MMSLDIKIERATGVFGESLYVIRTSDFLAKTFWAYLKETIKIIKLITLHIPH